MAQKSILSDTPKNLIKKYYQILKKDGLPVERIILFGSYTKGRSKYYSDLDLCVVSKKFGKDGYDEMVYLKKLTSQVETMIEPHPYHPQDLREKWDPLAHEIRAHGITFKFS